VFDALKPHLASAVVLGAVSVFTFLVRFYFNRLHADVSALAESVRKLEGRFDAVQNDVRANTTDVAVVRAVTEKEFAAVWRAVDPPPRISDRKG
jgi:outer membrane murein-binding lipoprotein Lpp